MRRSKTQFLAALVSAAYAVFLISYFGDISTTDLSGALAASLVTPHMICCALGAIFSVVAFFNNSKGMSLTAPILFCAGAALFPYYATMTLVPIVLGFVAYARVSSIHKQVNSAKEAKL